MGRKRRTRRKHSAYNLPNQPGVYLITSPTGRYYIGRSKDMRRRCLEHQYRAQSNTEENEILCRSIRKYGMRMRYEVLLQTYDEQDAVYFEDQYITMHWRDGKCMNAKVGDKITGDYNKDHKSKPVRYVHALTGGVICFASGTLAAQFFSPHSTCRTPAKRYGLLIQQQADASVMDELYAMTLPKVTVQRFWLVNGRVYETNKAAAAAIGCAACTLSNTLRAEQLRIYYNGSAYELGVGRRVMLA